MESLAPGAAEIPRPERRAGERLGPADLLNPIRAPREYDAANVPAVGAQHAAEPASRGLRLDSFGGIAASLDADSRVMFEEAIRVLQSLRIDREAVEAKLKESGREDPIRTVTGTSALDSAIERTEELIRRLHGAVVQ